MRKAIFSLIGRGLLRVSAQMEPIDVVKFVAIVGQGLEELGDVAAKEDERDREHSFTVGELREAVGDLSRRLASLEKGRVVS